MYKLNAKHIILPKRSTTGLDRFVQMIWAWVPEGIFKLLITTRLASSGFAAFFALRRRRTGAYVSCRNGIPTAAVAPEATRILMSGSLVGE